MKNIALLDSQVIRAALVALVGLIGLILSFFGVSEEAFGAKAAKLVDAALLVLTTGATLWAAYARATKPTPPITQVAAEATAARTKAEGGYARVGSLSLLLVLGMAAALLPACTGTRDAFKAADTVDEKAAVVGELYFATVKEAADLKNAGKLTGAKLAAVRATELRARPFILGAPATATTPAKPGVLQLADTYAALKNATNEAALQAAIEAAMVQLADLINLVKGAR